MKKAKKRKKPVTLLARVHTLEAKHKSLHGVVNELTKTLSAMMCPDLPLDPIDRTETNEPPAEQEGSVG